MAWTVRYPQLKNPDMMAPFHVQPHYFFITSLILLQLGACNEVTEETDTATQPVTHWVDPFIGTAAHGHTYPGAVLPFGMVQVSPDNGIEGWDWCSGYHYSDSVIIGFGHLHLSGTGIGDLTDIRLMPTIRQVDLSTSAASRDDLDYRGYYKHDLEQASPGLYEVSLVDQGIEVALTATLRSGLQRYRFPAGASSRSVVLDLAHDTNWDRPTEAMLEIVNDTLITGYRYSTGWAKDQRVYFAVTFSSPITSYIAADSTALQDTQPLVGTRLKSVFDFGEVEGNNLLVRTGISSASVDGALKSLAESDGLSFDEVAKQAELAWGQALQKITISSSNEALKRTFHTAMYHANLSPVTYSDPNQEYKGPNGEVNVSDGYTRYDVFSLWDTFRAAHPLFTITQPDKINDMIQSLLAHYDEHGLLPVWSLLGNETNTMTGYHAIPVIADAYFKGFRGYDVEKAYEAMKASAMQDIRGVAFYKEYGYIPSDLEEESVTKNLEYAFDDWCIAQMASDLGKVEDADYFTTRAQSYQKIYDASSGFMRGKMSDGSWRSPFDPKRSEHRSNTDYTEGNAWQHTWFVPHDVPGLISVMGGNEDFVVKLDSLFSLDSEITGDNVSVDISGLIGQYAHGNEPSHHVAYLYNYAGMPWKTQAQVREILRTQYTDQPDGLCGNDDCGQMSAWYIFSALGFYPVNPALGAYDLGSPLFEKAEINLGDGRMFTVLANGVSDDNLYVQSVKLNGEPLRKTYILHEEVMSGGVIEFEMGPEPNKDWFTTFGPES
ncbi:MAG: GH92 family glycosyl hydrolase [Bacteroidota bacterium]